jgi:hypothetical protein
MAKTLDSKPGILDWYGSEKCDYAYERENMGFLPTLFSGASRIYGVGKNFCSSVLNFPGAIVFYTQSLNRMFGGRLDE